MKIGNNWEQTIWLCMWGVCIRAIVSIFTLSVYARDKSGVLKASELPGMKV